MICVASTRALVIEASPCCGIRQPKARMGEERNGKGVSRSERGSARWATADVLIGSADSGGTELYRGSRDQDRGAFMFVQRAKLQ